MTVTNNRRIPYSVKLLYSAFVAIVVPLYWVTYSPWNFLYFCDIALLVTAAAIWMESPLLISMQAVAIMAPQLLWVVDLLCRVVGGVEITGVTSYMLNESIPLYLRGLSLFHGWLPFLLLWLVSRLGYDRRALVLQSAAAIAILLISYLFAPAPPPSATAPNHAVNINYVYGFTDKQPQTLMAPWLWLVSLMAIHIIAFYIPTHFVLRRVFALRRWSEASETNKQATARYNPIVSAVQDCGNSYFRRLFDGKSLTSGAQEIELRKKREAPRPDASPTLNYLCNEKTTSGYGRRRDHRHGLLRRHHRRSYRA